MKAIFVAVLLAVLPGLACAKGGGVALLMKGTVSELEVQGETIKFVLTGNFSFRQWRGPKQQESRVEVDGSKGIPVAVVQWKPFFAMTEDGGAGAIQERGALARILQAAAEQKRVVRFELVEARLLFGRDGRFSVARASVIRATDADLR